MEDGPFGWKVLGPAFLHPRLAHVPDLQGAVAFAETACENFLRGRQQGEGLVPLTILHAPHLARPADIPDTKVAISPGERHEHLRGFRPCVPSGQARSASARVRQVEKLCQLAAVGHVPESHAADILIVVCVPLLGAGHQDGQLPFARSSECQRQHRPAVTHQPADRLIAGVEYVNGALIPPHFRRDRLCDGQPQTRLAKPCAAAHDPGPRHGKPVAVRRQRNAVNGAVETGADGNAIRSLVELELAGLVADPDADHFVKSRRIKRVAVATERQRRHKRRRPARFDAQHRLLIADDRGFLRSAGLFFLRRLGQRAHPGRQQNNRRQANANAAHNDLLCTSRLVRWAGDWATLEN